MEDFNSKYTGQQVEDLLDQIANGEIGGGIEAETDPIFSASPAASITEEKKAEWDNKVDKVDGKQLSTEDFTTALKNKLSGLSNYDDTQINQTTQSLQTQINTLVRGNASNAIESFNEIIAFLDGIEDSQSLDSIVASIEQQIASKQPKIDDLESIRSGATKGSSAVQPDDLATVATSGDYNDLTNKPTIPAEQVNADWNATSGKAQILNKPTIPSAVTESTVSGWGFTKNTGSYSKPSGGIPKSDLASGVQSSLGKADTAVQPGDLKDEVYIADFTMESLRDGIYNGTNVNCDVRALVDAMNANKVILVRENEDATYKGVYVLNGYAEDLVYFSIVDTSGNILWCEGTDYISLQGIDAQTLHERSWDSKQGTLVSGENIKTINGKSILGSGNIEISGGSGDTGSGGGGGSSEKEIVTVTNGIIEVLEPNKIYILENLSGSVTFEIQSIVENYGNYAEFCVIIFAEPFLGAVSQPSISLPAYLRWPNGSVPDITKLGVYELNIVYFSTAMDSGFNAVLTHFDYAE